MKKINILMSIAAISVAFWACKKQETFTGAKGSKVTSSQVKTDDESSGQAVCYTSNFCSNIKKFSKLRKHHLVRSGFNSSQDRHEIYELEDGVYTKIETIVCTLNDIDWASSALKNSTKYGWRVSDADFSGQVGSETYTAFDFDNAPGAWSNWLDGSAGTNCFDKYEAVKVK